MLQDAGVNEDQLQILKLSGLVHEGKLTDTARLSEYAKRDIVIMNDRSYVAVVDSVWQTRTCLAIGICAP